MPKVKFLRDFRSRDTLEQFFERGQEWQATDEQAAGLLAEKAAELVDAPVSVEAAGAAPAAKKLGRPKKAKPDVAH